MKSLNRRNFLKVLGLTSAATLLPAGIRNSWAAQAAKNAALPAGEKALPETDSVAKAVNYASDGKKVDTKKFKQKTASASCKSCALYTKVNDGWGRCSMLTNGLVAADGWCASYNKKV